MSAPTTSAAARSLYRSLLRELPPLKTSKSAENTRKFIHVALRKQFTAAPAESLQQQQSRIALAKELKTYLYAQRGYVELLNQEEAFTDQENRERAARRVGLQLPSRKQ